MSLVQDSTLEVPIGRFLETDLVKGRVCGARLRRGRLPWAWYGWSGTG